MQTPARKSTRQRAPSPPNTAGRECRSASTLRSQLALAFFFLLVCSFGCFSAAPERSLTRPSKLRDGRQSDTQSVRSVEEKADGLQDWFTLKGFDNFRVPPEFAQFDVVGVRIFTVDNEPVAQVAVPENLMYFYCFSSQPLGINVVPEGSWRITESDRPVLAIREEKGMCFLVAFRGSKKDMKSLLEKAGALR